MDLIIKWMDVSGQWNEFKNSDLMHMPVIHAVRMFSNATVPVIARQDGRYIVNTDDLKRSYQKRKSPVSMFQDMLGRDYGDQRLGDSGFISPQYP